MRILALLASTTLLFACESTSSKGADDTAAVDEDPSDSGGEDTAGVDTDTSDTATDSGNDTSDSGSACEATIVSVTPDDGSEGQSLDAGVVVTLSEAAPAGSVTVTLAPVVSGVVTASDDGLTHTWTPDAPLARDTTYTASITACESSASTRFTTVGEATEAPIVGRTYDVELDGRDLTWTSPPSTVASLLVGNIDTTSLLFMVEAADAVSIDLLAAGGYEDGGSVLQYPCSPAIDFTPGDFASNPRFDLGPQDASLAASGIDVPLYGLTVSGRFEEDASAMREVRVQARIDVRDLGDLTGFGDVCTLLPVFGVSCVDCPDGETQCLELDAVDDTAPWRSSVTLDADIDTSACL
jgi:hypothetical protein